jgi:hypothetical protein
MKFHIMLLMFANQNQFTVHTHIAKKERFMKC